MTNKYFRILLLAGASLAGVGSAPAFAQESPAGKASASQSLAPTEIVVTAQKRDETVQTTPATVSVLSPTLIQDFRVNDLQSVQRLVPGFQFEFVAGVGAIISIRGIGTTTQGQSLDQSVAPYLNGVYLGGFNRDFTWPLFDLDHIEVFKGTQSGIAGQSTSIGIVNMTTKLPGDVVGGYLQAGGEFVNGGYNAEGAIDLPVTDRFKTRFSGYYSKRGGWVKDVVTGNTLGDQTTWAGRVNAVWEATDSVKAQFYAEYDHQKQIGGGLQVVTSDPTGAYAAYVAPYFTWHPNNLLSDAYGHDWDPNVGVNFDGNDGAIAETFKASARFDVQLGKHTLTSITAGSFDNERLSVDLDYSHADVPTASNPVSGSWQAENNRYHQFTQEIRLASPQDERLSYIIGAWYRHAYTKILANFYFGTVGPRSNPLPGTLTAVSEPFHQTVDNASLYADAEYKLNDWFSVGGTVRYTHEKKIADVTGNLISGYGQNSTFPAFPTYNSRIISSYWNNSARITIEPRDNLRLYALYSNGRKTGALINLVASGTLATALPEDATTYEIGAKTELFDRRLMLSIAAFHQYVKNYQDSYTVRINNNPVFIAQNTNVRTNGFDAQIGWQISGLSLSASAEYLDAVNKSLGGTFVRSPKWSLGGNARYAWQMFGARTSIFGNVLRKTSYFNLHPTQAARPFTITPAYTTLDVGAEVKPSERMTISVLCKNCTDQFIRIKPNRAGYGPTAANAYFALPPELRTVSLQVKYNF